MPDPIPTGTGAARRRLTVHEALRGARPDAFTSDEWAALHRASRDLSEPCRQCGDVRGLPSGGCPLCPRPPDPDTPFTGTLPPLTLPP